MFRGFGFRVFWVVRGLGFVGIYWALDLGIGVYAAASTRDPHITLGRCTLPATAAQGENFNSAKSSESFLVLLYKLGHFLEYPKLWEFS